MLFELTQILWVLRANKHYLFQVTGILGVPRTHLGHWITLVLNILFTYPKDWTCIFYPSIFKEKGQVLIFSCEGPRNSLSLKSTSLNTLHHEILFFIFSHMCQINVSWACNCSYKTILNLNDKVNPHFVQNKQKHCKHYGLYHF